MDYNNNDKKKKNRKRSKKNGMKEVKWEKEDDKITLYYIYKKKLNIDVASEINEHHKEKKNNIIIA